MKKDGIWKFGWVETVIGMEIKKRQRKRLFNFPCRLLDVVTSFHFSINLASFKFSYQIERFVGGSVIDGLITTSLRWWRHFSLLHLTSRTFSLQLLLRMFFSFLLHKTLSTQTINLISLLLLLQTLLIIYQVFDFL